MFWGFSAESDHWVNNSVGKYFDENYLYFVIIYGGIIIIAINKQGNWGSEKSK